MRFKRYKPFYFQKKEQIIKTLLYKNDNQQQLFRYAQQVRDEAFSKKVEVRSVIEYSNMCQQVCNYCGINRNSSLKRYVLSDEEFLSRVDRLYNAGRRVIMIQTGECNSDEYFNKLHNLLKEIKNDYSDLSLICSLGNLSRDKYKKLRDIGIERYLLKFETSDPLLYKKIKPSDTLRNRLMHINLLKELGFYVSSGNITGLPGQPLESLADDLILLKELDLPMGSTSIFIPNDLSNYADLLPGDIDITLNFMAILRIMCPNMVIPTTSSMELVKKGGQYFGLLAGANAITLHDGTPEKDEEKYVIYKKDRYKPKKVLFKILKKADLQASLVSLVRDKPENTLFYKLINKNLKYSKVAVYSEDHGYSYGDLMQLTSRFCSFLEKSNIKERQVVLLAVYDSIEFIIAFLSCIRLGIIIAPIDPQLSKDELRFILSNTRPDHILATDSVCRRLKGKRALKIADDNSSSFFLSLLRKQNKSNKFVWVDRNSPAMILYTSGTTGRPKGVVHSYKDLFVDNFPRIILKITDKDRIFSCSRMHTGYGLGNSLFFPFHFGASTILSRSTVNDFSLHKILKFKPTLFFAVPSMYEYLLSHKEALGRNLHLVRIFISSGDKLYGDIFNRWKDEFNSKILECFGSTEMCHPFISNLPGQEKPNSCGKIISGFQFRFDKSGCLFYKGLSLFSGYYNDNELTQERIVYGWFKSDDIGYRNKDGYIFLSGRKNSVFKLAGRWVSILDIESKLRKYSLIKEITIIKRKEGLQYCLSLKRDRNNHNQEKRIRRYCTKHLKIYELPKYISILREIPKTRSGKIDRKRLDRMEVKDEGNKDFFE